jgi:hypothetical protein
MRHWLATVLHPLLFAAAPILLLAAHNYDQVRLSQLAAPLIVSVLGALVLLGLLRFILGDWQKAAVLTSMCAVAFFTYGHVHELLASLQLMSKTRYIHYVLMPAYLLAIAAGGLTTLRVRRDLTKFCQALTVFGLVICTIATVQLASRKMPASGPSTFARSQDAKRMNELLAQAHRAEGELPNIYYIILDGYARDDVLQKYYDFDNTPFLKELEKRGFYVARQSSSNYMHTFLSLTSSLEMRYLDMYLDHLEPSDRDQVPMYEVLWNNRVGRLLKAAGYELVHFRTNYAPTQESDIADIQLPQPALEFYMVLGSTTMLKPMISLGIVPWLSAPSGGHLYRFMFDTIEETPTWSDRPRFVFAHLVCPHPPALLDRDGNVTRAVEGIELGDIELWKDREGYLGQVEFCNRRALEVIDTLLAKSTRRPVIIIQADHGTASNYHSGQPAAQQEQLVEERSGILNAYLVPEGVRERLHQDITPVNSFRILLSDLLGLDLEPLEERVYFSWYDAPYDFVDVTDEVHPGSEETSDSAK